MNIYLVTTSTDDGVGNKGTAQTIVKAADIADALMKIDGSREFVNKMLLRKNVKSIQLMESDVVTINIGTAIPF